MMISFVFDVEHLVEGGLYLVKTLHSAFVCPSHRFRLCIFPVIIIDVMKSEERQKLAKERREEKAKYFGKYSRSKALGTCCAGGELPLVLGWKQVVLSFTCVKSGGTPGHRWDPHHAQEGQKSS